LQSFPPFFERQPLAFQYLKLKQQNVRQMQGVIN